MLWSGHEVVGLFLFCNTILLRLVDAFCCGDKVVKVAVVRVFMSMFKLSRRRKKNRSSWFLSKGRVYNHLEMLKRVKSVYDKSDYEGKALALILFGCWRDFACEFAPVRFLIFTSMVSSHDLEVRSSLFAAACFCEIADDFSLVVLGMLDDMVKFPGMMPKTRLALGLKHVYDVYDEYFDSGLDVDSIDLQVLNEAQVVGTQTEVVKRSLAVERKKSTTSDEPKPKRLIKAKDDKKGSASNKPKHLLLLSSFSISAHSQLFRTVCRTGLLGEVPDLLGSMKEDGVHLDQNDV